MEPTFSVARRIFDALQPTQQKLAKDIMTKDVHTLSPSAPLKKALSLMKEHNISQIPITQYGHIIGIITERSLLHTPEATLAQDAYDILPPIVDAETKTAVLRSLFEHTAIVLVQEKGKLVGVIARIDLLTRS